MSASRRRVRGWVAAGVVVVVVGGIGAAVMRAGAAPPAAPPAAAASTRVAVGRMRPTHAVRPGITVLLRDSAALIRGKRIGLLTNQTGVDEHGVSDIDLLFAQRRKPGGARLVALFSPEHGIRGTEDHTDLASGVDARTGLPVYSLYGATTLAPPDSTLRGLDALVIDLQDLGARPWTFVASMVYALRAAAAHHLPVLVLDRPNPITGAHVEGPVLSQRIAYAGSDSPARRARPTALYPIPMRHGLTMGELARFYDAVLGLHADLHVIPMAGWRRRMWFDQTGLPWVQPSPNMPSLASATLYPGMVWLESTNVSVGRGTPIAFQQFGAPWLRARRVAAWLTARHLPGVRFWPVHFTPRHPTDDKYGGRTIPGVRIGITDRDHLDATRVGAAVFSAIARTGRDSLRIRVKSFDELMGVPAARAAFLAGGDPDSIVRASAGPTAAFVRASRPYRLYR